MRTTNVDSRMRNSRAIFVTAVIVQRELGGASARGPGLLLTEDTSWTLELSA